MIIPANLEKRVLLDCDEVLLNWWRGMAEYLAINHGIVTHPDGPKNFGMSNWIENADKATILGYIRKFNSANGTGFERLKPVPGAIEAISALRASGHDLHVVTSASADPAVLDLRIQNLENVFGKGVFTDVICLDLGAPKTPQLARHSPSLWIDDLAENVRDGIKAGHFGIIMQASHNKDCFMSGRYNDLPWAEDWHQIMMAMELLPKVNNPFELV